MSKGCAWRSSRNSLANLCYLNQPDATVKRAVLPELGEIQYLSSLGSSIKIKGFILLSLSQVVLWSSYVGDPVVW